MPRRTVIHANATVEGGLGHFMRALALAQDAVTRGWAVEILGDILPVVREKSFAIAPDVHVDSIPAEEIVSRLHAAAESADILHLDTYDTVADLRGHTALISSMQDGSYGVRPADLVVDANLGAEVGFVSGTRSVPCLIGIDAAVIRLQTRAQRAVSIERTTRPRVLVVMGGTDPRALTQIVLEGLTRIETPLEITVVAAPERHDSLRELVSATPHTLALAAFVSDLPALARQQTLVVTASGTSVWDFACIGAPMALVCAVDNQRRGYHAALAEKICVGLGEPPHSDLADRVARLESLLTEQTQLSSSAALGMGLVDGLGTWRIISAWEELSDARRSESPPEPDWTARPATMADAQTLFDWRNDNATRSHSRSQQELVWDDHIAWLERCTNDANRMLLLVSKESTDFGTVRWDRQSNYDWQVSITLAPHSRGKGLASAVLAAGERALQVEGPVRMLASIHVDNGASRRLFQNAGYLPQLPADENGFETRAKWRFPNTTHG